MKQQVLVIDGSKAIRFLLETILGKKYRVITVAGGCAAMQWLSRGNQPDIIITDPQLQDMQNWELIEFLTSSGMYGKIPVIVLSSLDKEETKKKCGELKLIEHFVKPFNPLELQNAVEALLTYTAGHIHFNESRLQKVG